MLRRHRRSSSTLARSAVLRSSSAPHREDASYIARLSKSTKPSVPSPPSGVKEDYKEYKALYNADVSKFRDIFNSNDISQVPFMSTLRRYSKSSECKTRVSNSPRFEQATKSTFSYQTAKRIKDFRTNSSLLAPVFFRWHNKSGRNNLWSTDFQCSLRNYGTKYNPEEERYNNLRQPIVYKDVELQEYNPHELTCPRQQRTFRIKRE